MKKPKQDGSKKNIEKSEPKFSESSKQLSFPFMEEEIKKDKIKEENK